MNRLECVTETMRFVLNSLTAIVPDWLAGHLQPDWAKRYGPRADEFHLPKASQQRQLYAKQVGQDGFGLMSCLDGHEQAALLWQLACVDLLRRVWLQWSATAAVSTGRQPSALAHRKGSWLA